MAKIPTPTASPETWDTVQIGSYVMPGIASCDVSRSQRVDVKPSAGSDGATETDQGVDPAKVEITCRIWKEEHWVGLSTLLHSLSPTPGKKAGRKPKSIIHPTTRRARVKSIKILSVSMPKPVGKQIFEIKISAIEFFPPPKKAPSVTVTAKSADPAVAKVQTATGNASAAAYDALKLFPPGPGYSPSSKFPDP